MIRRTFLILIGMLGLGSITIFSMDSSLLRRLYYKIENLIKPPLKLPPDNQRSEVKLSHVSATISVEMALNSRCTSDYDGNPKKFHWGMFDKTKKLSIAQIEKIIHLARIPRFTDRKVGIQSDRNVLTFVIENHASGLLRDWIMVESGMQQQAIGLVCAAMGVGMVFRNLGKDGTNISNMDYGTIRIKLDAMKPTYAGSFWSSLAPHGKKVWKKGSLPFPIRDGNKSLISTLGIMKIENRGGRESTDESVSQLLWAARGRTPHFYKSRPWGMTIPTWGGKQDISSVYLISDNKVYRYVNWHRGRPTHSLTVFEEIDIDLRNELIKIFPSNNSFIVIGRNEDFGRALWEVGYQMLNLLLQAHTLGITFQAVLLDEISKTILSRMHIENPVAIVALKRESE